MQRNLLCVHELLNSTTVSVLTVSQLFPDRSDSAVFKMRGIFARRIHYSSKSPASSAPEERQERGIEEFWIDQVANSCSEK